MLLAAIGQSVSGATFAAGLQGSVSMGVYYPDQGVASLRNSASALIGPGIEFGTAAGGTPAPGTVLVAAAVDVSPNAISLEYANGSGTFLTAPFNGYIFRFPSLAGGSLYSVTAGSGNNVPAAISHTRNSVSINASGLPFSNTSVIKLDVKVAAPSYITSTGVKPLISAELIPGSVSFTNNVYLSGVYANNLTGERTPQPRREGDDIYDILRSWRKNSATTADGARTGSAFASELLGAGGPQRTTAKGAAYGIVTQQLIDQIPDATPFDQKIYNALLSLSKGGLNYAMGVYTTASAALLKEGERIFRRDVATYDAILKGQPGHAPENRLKLDADAPNYSTTLTRGAPLDSTVASVAGQQYGVVDLYIESFAAALEDKRLASASMELAQAALTAGDRAAAEMQMGAASAFLTSAELSFIDAAGYMSAAHSVLGFTSSSLGFPRVLDGAQLYLATFGITDDIRASLKAGGFSDQQIDAAISAALSMKPQPGGAIGAEDYLQASQGAVAGFRPSQFITAVPEPGSFAMLSGGLLALVFLRRRAAGRTGA